MDQIDDVEDLVTSYSWRKQWYPVAVASCTDPTKPHPFILLGTSVVLWKDPQKGKWCCFVDECPHRFVPLSEGRVVGGPHGGEEGALECAYHGWRFNGEGKCTKIPQCAGEEAERKCKELKQSECRVYPVMEDNDLIWVWADPSSPEASQKTQPRLIPELLDPSYKAMPWNFRDLPYGWDYFIENVVDPAHVPVSHHRVAGNKKDACFIDMEPFDKATLEEGFGMMIKSSNPLLQSIRSTTEFRPPCLVKITQREPNGAVTMLILYATPTQPGWCRHVGRLVTKKSDDGKKNARGLAFFGVPFIPTSVLHATASWFLHQDMVFLHAQEKILSVEKRSRKYFTPNPQDKGVIAFRRWMKQACGKKEIIPYCNEENPTNGYNSENNLSMPYRERKPESLFDVWHTHTSNCTKCLKGAHNTKMAMLVFYLFALLVLVLQPVFPSSSSAWVVLLNVLLAGGLATVAYGLQLFYGLFFVYKYHHSNNP